MVVELPDLRGYLADLPPLEAVPRVQHRPVLLLELPQLRVDVEGAAEVGLPLFVPVLGQVTEAVEKLLRLLQQMTKLTHHLEWKENSQ